MVGWISYGIVFGWVCGGASGMVVTQETRVVEGLGWDLIWDSYWLGEHGCCVVGDG